MDERQRGYQVHGQQGDSHIPGGKSVYVCRRTNGIQYEQTKLVAENSTSFDFAVVGKWWAIYYDGAEASANETGERQKSLSLRWKIQAAIAGAIYSQRAALCLRSFLTGMWYT